MLIDPNVVIATHSPRWCAIVLAVEAEASGRTVEAVALDHLAGRARRGQLPVLAGLRHLGPDPLPLVLDADPGPVLAEVTR